MWVKATFGPNFVNIGFGTRANHHYDVDHEYVLANPDEYNIVFDTYSLFIFERLYEGDTERVVIYSRTD